jgi:predicted kinase
MLNALQTYVASTVPMPLNDTLADDLLRGAEAIADFLYGDPTQRRKVYHLAETSRLPIFRLGSVLCARRTVLLHWINQQEQRGYPQPRKAA